MRSLLRLVSLLALLWAAPAWALQPVYVDQMGARPDGVVRTDCSITSGSAVLTCTAGKFTPADVGKVIGVYEAKAANNGYLQVLATTILSRQSATQVTLATAATATANPASRMVYGTDNTTTLQRIIDTTVAAPDGRGGNVGGRILLGPGTYLVKTLSFPCSRVGAFSVGRAGDPQSCPRAYNNIALQGAGQQATTLENWDPSVTTPLLSFGTNAMLPATYNDGNALQSGITLSDFTMRQVVNAPSTNAKGIASSSAPLVDSLIERVTVTGTSYECLYVLGWRLTIRQNYASGCGPGGPGYALTLSAYNVMLCVECLFESNVYDTQLGAGSYAFEGSLRRGIMQNNHFTCTDQGPGGVQLASSSLGSYYAIITHNVFQVCGLVVVNGNGTADVTTIKSNLFINSELELSSGTEAQSVLGAQWGPTDTTSHGVTTVDGNVFLIDGTTTNAPTASGINLGGATLTYMSQESFSISQNSLVVRQTYCTAAPTTKCQASSECAAGVCAVPGGLIYINESSGGVRWTPSTACTASAGPYAFQQVASTYVFPVVYNGYYYRCTTSGTTGTTEPTWPTTTDATVSDGSAVWTNAGRKPTISIRNNSIHGPEQRVLDYERAAASEVSFRANSDRDAVLIENFSANYPWMLQNQGAVNMPSSNELVPAGVAYGDMNRFMSALPTLGYYQINTIINNTAPSAGHRGWVATRAGRAGATWQAGHAYSFGDWVVPTGDNGHAFTQRTGAGCTSASPTEPSWNTSTNGLTTDNDCSWKESGAAVLWVEF